MYNYGQRRLPIDLNIFVRIFLATSQCTSLRMEGATDDLPRGFETVCASQEGKRDRNNGDHIPQLIIRIFLTSLRHPPAFSSFPLSTE
eukprot:scaffold24650_cov147-Cylindrotheca_fusiformis.AAC.2